MLFYGPYVREVVHKETGGCSCCITNVRISCYVIFQETLSKYTCKSIHYVSLILESLGRVCVILNDEVWRFKFSLVDNESYLFLMFDGFNVPVDNVGYYLLV